MDYHILVNKENGLNKKIIANASKADESWNGEGLVAPENVADIKDLLSTVPTMNNLIDKLLPLQNIPIQKNQQIKPVNIESVQQVFELPNVTDVDSFIKEAKNNPKMARFMDDMVYDRMTGDNSVSRW